tara:strand:- start:303 stop:494 length:192 start_codon:yes stop_codon:yes gene_type:complete
MADQANEEGAGGVEVQQTFQEMRSTIEEKIDDLIFKTFKQRVYDSKDAQKWCNDTSELIIKLL